MVIVRLGLGLCRPDGTTLHLREPARPSMVWQSPRRRSSEILKLTTEETTAVGDDPKSGVADNSYRGQSLFPAAMDLSITEPHSEWRS